jgi:Lrp/AsnC family transcriptional regulator for asnA, asnC and gidA
MLDEVDKKILKMLMENSRTPYTRIAEKVGMSEPAIKKRIDKLVKEGVITSFSVNVDPWKLGKNLIALVFINASPGKHREVAEMISEIEEVVEVSIVTGQFDMMAKIVCENPKHFERTIKKIGSIPEVLKTESFVVIEQIEGNKFMGL